MVLGGYGWSTVLSSQRFDESRSWSISVDKEDKYKYLARIQMVHIDDVTNARIFLLEHPNADERYLCSAIDITIDKMCETLSSKYPEYPIATSDALKEIECFTPSHLSSKKLLDTGFKFKYDLEEVYDETIRCCEEKGFL
ncbi:hypothetical protein CsSME_00012520 [Camellia sinensis var. sinensis]